MGRTAPRVVADHPVVGQHARLLELQHAIERGATRLARQSHQAPARSTVLVREAVTGAIEIRYRGRLKHWTELSAPAPKVPAPAVPVRPLAAAATRARSRPNADHPWRRGYAEREQRAAELARP